jgi:ferredoxin-NADP reductase
VAWLPAYLVETRDETATARTLVLRVDGWPGHLAGQHVDVRLTAGDGYTAQRTYSIASAPDGDVVEVTVQLVPGGEVSEFLVRDFTVGNPVELRGPVGGWFVWHPAIDVPVLAIGGGSGVVPVMAMLRAHRLSDSTVPFQLLYSVRGPGEVFYRTELGEGGSAGVGVTIAYTREAPDGWPRPPHRLTKEDIPAPADPPGRVYVCGPTGFVESVAALLVDAGHDPQQIRTERFGPSGG